ARVKLLSPVAMRARLESRLQLFTGGARDLPVRQQTLRGAIDWSHGLLNEAEQRLFRRLSVFVGGCTLEAAEAVCNAREDLGLDRCRLEHDNYRAALDWMIETGEAEWGLRLGAALFRFWDERDLLAEGRDRLMRVLRLPKAGAYAKPRARALFAAGVLAGEQR